MVISKIFYQTHFKDGNAGDGDHKLDGNSKAGKKKPGGRANQAHSEIPDDLNETRKKPTQEVGNGDLADGDKLKADGGDDSAGKNKAGNGANDGDSGLCSNSTKLL